MRHDELLVTVCCEIYLRCFVEKGNTTASSAIVRNAFQGPVQLRKSCKNIIYDPCFYEHVVTFLARYFICKVDECWNQSSIRVALRSHVRSIESLTKCSHDILRWIRCLQNKAQKHFVLDLPFNIILIGVAEWKTLRSLEREKVGTNSSVQSQLQRICRL